EATREFQEDQYLKVAQSVCDFILHDLPRTETDQEACFSYSPKDDTKIFNASLLAAEVLAGVGGITGEGTYLRLAEKSARYVVNNQRDNGSWVYGMEPNQGWVDNFHTAFILFSLQRIIKACTLGDEFKQSLAAGYEYWRKTFFLADGWPKYYDD